jgi:hypothetical protein
MKRLMSFDFEVDDTNDSIEVLADVLGGDFEKIAKQYHDASINCVEIRIDGAKLDFDAMPLGSISYSKDPREEAIQSLIDIAHVVGNEITRSQAEEAIDKFVANF